LGTALSFPLPENPDTELLDRARQEVLTYLDWVAHDVAFAGDVDEIRREITRAAARLIEISIHWRAACDAELEQHLAQERVEHDRQRREQNRALGFPDDA
jgi:hypothetical protein